MRITCPSCGTGYDVADDAIGAQGRKVRCRTCGASWVEAPRGGPAAPIAPSPEIPKTAPPPGDIKPAPAPVLPASIAEEPALQPPAPNLEDGPPRPRRLRAPLIALALVIVAVALGIAVAGIVMGPAELASEFGLAGRRVPLGIAITRPPDWRQMAGNNQYFAISGRIWNPTAQTQPVPDVRADIRDKSGHVIHHWIIARPAKELPPGGHVDFDGAAMDVPRESATVVLSFVGKKD